MLQKSVSVLAVAACLVFAPQASAQDVPPTEAEADAGDGGDIVVIGSGQTRSVSTLSLIHI